MIARLTRFYGGDPWRWFTEIPLAFVRACARMLPRLQAEEAFAGLAVNTGELKEDGFKAYQRQWSDAMRPIGAVTRERPRPNPAQLAAIGIGVRRVKVEPRGTDGR